MSTAINDQDIILKASIEANTLASEAVTANTKQKDESSDSMKTEQLAGILQLCGDQVVAITDQLQ